MQKKAVRFDHFRPYMLCDNKEGGKTEKVYSLKYLFQTVKSVPLAKTAKKIFGDIYRFHVCEYDSKLGIWEIQILHLREKILPGIADERGAYELIQLEDGKYPAESTTILYDEVRNVLYMQRNIYGTSIKCLELFLEELSPEKTSVLLKPLIKGNKISKITPSNLYRRVVLVADANEIDERIQGKTTLAQTLSSFEKYQGRIIKLELGFGKAKKGFLKSDVTADLVKQAYNFKGTQKLLVSTSDPTDIAFETIDLLDDREKFVINLEYSRESPITHGKLFFACLNAYKQALGIE